MLERPVEVLHERELDRIGARGVRKGEGGRRRELGGGHGARRGRCCHGGRRGGANGGQSSEGAAPGKDPRSDPHRAAGQESLIVGFRATLHATGLPDRIQHRTPMQRASAAPDRPRPLATASSDGATALIPFARGRHRGHDHRTSTSEAPGKGRAGGPPSRGGQAGARRSDRRRRPFGGEMQVGLAEIHGSRGWST